MARLGSLNNKVFHEDSHSTRTQNGTSTDSRIYQYRRQRSQRSELSRKETYFVSQGSRAVRKVVQCSFHFMHLLRPYFITKACIMNRIENSRTNFSFTFPKENNKTKLRRNLQLPLLVG
uniref:Uncharacterized protein n=1 Tax=Wuchereria bancrofti TaxID=6293 RepID=A0AAF5Q0L4_WUCBA